MTCPACGNEVLLLGNGTRPADTKICRPCVTKWIRRDETSKP